MMFYIWRRAEGRRLVDSIARHMGTGGGAFDWSSDSCTCSISVCVLTEAAMAGAGLWHVYA